LRGDVVGDEFGAAHNADLSFRYPNPSFRNPIRHTREGGYLHSVCSGAYDIRREY